MTNFTIQSAADFWRTSRAPKAFTRFLRAARRIFTFVYERANRLRRCVEIIDLYAKGVPVRDIVDRYGCSNHTVNRYARAAGLPKRPKHFPEKIRLAAIAMYKDGKPIAEIQARLGVSQAYVSNLATEEGINRRKFKKR
jgi:transposase-like protein